MILLGLGSCASRPLSDSDGTTPQFELAAVDLAAKPLDLASPNPPPLRGIPCGKRVCNENSNEVCCNNSSCTALFACGPYASEAVGCDGPEDCNGGDLCCLFDDANANTITGCRASCATRTTPWNGRICHSAADCAPQQSCCRVPYTEYELYGCFDSLSC